MHVKCYRQLASVSFSHSFLSSLEAPLTPYKQPESFLTPAFIWQQVITSRPRPYTQLGDWDYNDACHTPWNQNGRKCIFAFTKAFSTRSQPLNLIILAM